MTANAQKVDCTETYTFENLKDVVQCLYNEKSSLRRVAREGFGGCVSFGAVQRVLAGHEPHDPEVRRAFGLADYHAIVIVGPGVVPPGTQVITAEQCSCGAWFIPNHPRRRRCFVCSPYRGRKR